MRIERSFNLFFKSIGRAKKEYLGMTMQNFAGGSENLCLERRWQVCLLLACGQTAQYASKAHHPQIHRIKAPPRPIDPLLGP
jgi:hypothetical protein